MPIHGNYEEQYLAAFSHIPDRFKFFNFFPNFHLSRFFILDCAAVSVQEECPKSIELIRNMPRAHGILSIVSLRA